MVYNKLGGIYFLRTYEWCHGEGGNMGQVALAGLLAVSKAGTVLVVIMDAGAACVSSNFPEKSGEDGRQVPLGLEMVWLGRCPTLYYGMIFASSMSAT